VRCCRAEELRGLLTVGEEAEVQTRA
jgi:hypothetical protein